MSRSVEILLAFALHFGMAVLLSFVAPPTVAFVGVGFGFVVFCYEALVERNNSKWP
mgnify:CR=1 FL=1